MKLPPRSAVAAVSLLCGLLVSSATGCAADDGSGGSPEQPPWSGGAASDGGSPGTSGGALGVGGIANTDTGGIAQIGGAGGASSTGGTGGAGGTTVGTGGAFASTGGASSTGGAGGSPIAPGPGPVGRHGALHVNGNRIVDAAGAPVQLRGMSLFWTQWTDYYAPHTVDQLADDWHATVVRGALGVESGGYLSNPSDNEAKLLRVVDRAIERGLYVIIDWHDQNAHNHQSAAVDFFTRMATRYGSSPGVIFEIYNEPVHVAWSTVKSYAQVVIGAIRGAGAPNLVIVGTPTWSQDVDVAAANPITGYADVAYALHFYAATHKQSIRDKAKRALDAGLALFVTEWGTCEASGNGSVDQGETATWLNFLAQNQISWANWALNDKAESCSALTPGAGTSGPWTGAKLTPSGALVKSRIP